MVGQGPAAVRGGLVKPCASCPFLPSAPTGFWHPSHYLLIAYLGSVRTPVESMDASYRMGCHKHNSVIQPDRSGVPPRCGGWLRAARDAIAVQIPLRLGRLSPEELRDLEDDVLVLSPEEMARANGLDLARLPPLDWNPADPRYPTFRDWAVAVLVLRTQLADDPELAREYVVPGSPLDRSVSQEEVERALGPAAAERYARSSACSNE